MVKRVNAIKARQNLGRLLEEVYYKGNQYVIERAGRPMAAVVPLWQVEERNARRDRVLRMVEAVWQKNKTAKPATIEREVAAAVRAVRTTPGRKRS